MQEITNLNTFLIQDIASKMHEYQLIVLSRVGTIEGLKVVVPEYCKMTEELLKRIDSVNAIYQSFHDQLTATLDSLRGDGK